MRLTGRSAPAIGAALLVPVLALAACAGPSLSPSAVDQPSLAVPATGEPNAAARTGPLPTANPLLTPPPTPAASLAPDSLVAQLPTAVNGVALTRMTLDPARPPAPRAFLKVIARVGGTPPGSGLALAFEERTRVYAMRVADVQPGAILQAFLAERVGAASSSAPVETVGGKDVTRVGRAAGTFVYANGDTFFYIEAPDEAAAADVLALLP